VGENINTLKKNTAKLFYARKQVDIEVNADETKWMCIFCHQNAGQNHDIKTANNFLENVTEVEIFWKCNNT
jgi:hypothetical protein